jgi:hypothetical protein
MNDHIPDATKMINDTPRMQSALLDAPDAGFAKIWQVGCEIERELNRAVSMYKKLDIHALDLVDRIIRLEAAGDVVEKKLGCGCGCYNLCKDCQRASENWNKAKEAKP